MSKKHDVNKINLQVNDVGFFKNGMVILWSSDIGFGEYTIVKKEEGELIGLSECMDCQEDKAFIKKLLELLAEKLNIKE